MLDEGSRLCYECSSELHDILEKITKSSEDAEDIIWITVLSIVRHMFFRIEETAFSIVSEDRGEIGFLVNMKGMECNNFFSVVKHVKESMNNLLTSGKKDIMICRNPNITRVEAYSLQFVRSKDEEKTKISVNFNEKVIVADELKNFMKILFKAASFFTQNPQKLIKEVKKCFEEDYNIICSVFNATVRDYPSSEGIFSIFKYQSEKFSNNIALICNEQEYTYSSLYHMVCRQISNLRKNDVKEKDVVGIFLNDKLEQIINIFAVLGCGGAYLPIDVSYPEKRIEFMLKDTKTEYVIAPKEYREYGIFKQHIICPFSELTDNDMLNDSLDNMDNVCGEDIAYIMYTSGSTGIPRGVAIRQKSVLRLVKNNDFLQITKNDRILQTSTIVFDASIIEIYGALLNGACLVLTEKEDVIEPKRMKELIQKKITIMWLSSPLFTQLASQDSYLFKGLKHLIVGGDVLSPNHINMVRKNCDGIEIINGYGPTENTTFSTTYSIKNDFSNSIPIGKPISNSTAYILDENHELLPIGAIGEIGVGGDGVGFGYLNNEQLNKEKFIDNPYGEGKLYLTGDNGYWTEDGNIEYVGRKDYQFKINGFRVETGEIENAVCGCAGVNLAFALIENIKNQKKIVLIYSGDVKTQEVKHKLKEQLPMYMFPNIIMKLERIPFNINGKLDRAAIRELINNMNEETEEDKEQLNEYEQIVSDAVNGMANAGYIKPHDNLFEMSFDSLRLAMLITRLNEIFHSAVRFSEIFSDLTIIGIARCFQSARTGKVNSIAQAPSAEKYAASSIQKRIYYATNIDNEGVNYNVPALFQFKHTVDAERIRTVWQQLIERHEILRTNFVMDEGELYQIIEKNTDFHVVQIDCMEKDILIWVKDKITKFDLQHDMLIRVYVFHTEESLYMLVDMHHIIMDGFSVDLLFKEFCLLFRGEVLIQNIFQNKDVIYSKQFIFNEKVLERQKQFWLSSMKNFEISDDIVTDFHRTQSMSRKGIEKAYQIGNREMVERIKKYSVNHNSTVFSILLSAMYLTIWKYSKKHKVAAGVPFSGRTLNGMNQVLGMFVNVMPVAVEVDPNQKIEDFIAYVKDLVLQGYENQEYQFDSLVSELHLPREKNRNFLFNFTFNVYTHNDEFILDEEEENELKKIELNYDIIKFDFSIVVLVTKNELILKVQFDNSLYKQSTIDQFMNCYKHMIPILINQSESVLSHIDIAIPEEKEQIMCGFNNTKTDYERYHNVIEGFQDTVRKWPDKIALDYKNTRISYSELLSLVNKRAGYLKKTGMEHGALIAILIEDKLEQIIAILTVLSAGGVYVPIAPDYPPERIRYILEHSEAQVLLMDNEYEKIRDVPIRKLVLSKLPEEVDSETLDLNTTSEDLAYIMYTSGTSGKPKGVMIKHKGILRLVINNQFIQLDETDNMFQTSSIVFDASTFEIWNALIHGMTFYLSDKADLFDGERLKQIIAEKGITVMWLTAPLFRQIGDRTPDCFKALKWLLVGGDILPVDIVNRVQSRCRQLRIINGYGPTENTTFSTTYEVKEFCYKSIPIGKSISNSEVYILDQWHHILPIGAVGEIYVGGDGLAKGYLKDDEMTADKFVCITLNSVKKNLYATGDLGYWDQEGNVIFLGRLDNQVKIRGFRIETDEIYTTVMEQEGIQDAAIKILQEEEKCIALFYVSETQSENELKKLLRQKLPEFMVPKYIIKTNRIPLNENGKVDSAALEQMVQNHVQEEKEAKPEIVFASEYEKVIYQIWSEVLGTDLEGIDVNFFDAGGNSMYLLMIYEKLTKKLGKRISISDLFVYTTIREIAKKFEESESKKNRPCTMELCDELVENHGNQEPQFLQYVFTVSRKELQRVQNEKSMLLLLFALVLKDSAKGEVNINLYDEQKEHIIFLTGLAEQPISSVSDVLEENRKLHKQISRQGNAFIIDTLNYEHKSTSSNTARLLYCNGKSPDKYEFNFDIICMMQMKQDVVEIEVSFDCKKYKESNMEKLIESYHNTINFVLNNIQEG